MGNSGDISPHLHAGEIWAYIQVYCSILPQKEYIFSHFHFPKIAAEQAVAEIGLGLLAWEAVIRNIAFARAM